MRFAFPRIGVLTLAAAVAAGARAEPSRSGSPSLNVRARYEGVDQDGRRDAAAFTLRTRLGWTTPTRDGFHAYAEVENIVSPAGDHYSQAGLNPGAAGRAVVADPEVTELNQAWLAWTRGDMTVQLGRQRLVLDDARFFGDVGWRQNMQTFDAVTLIRRLPPNTVLTLAYVDRVNRVFGHRHPQGSWESRSGVVHLTRAGLPGDTTVSVHASLLDFPSAPAQGCATAGISAQGIGPLSSALRLSWKAGAALQSDHGASPLRYTAHWYNFEVGLAAKPGQIALGIEELGSDRGQAFRTPLATLHAFNGWADIFLTTPSAGLRDSYARAGFTLPPGLTLAAWYHRFESAGGGSRLGEEIDVQASRRVGRHVTAVAKLAAFRPATPALPGVRKFWLQLEYSL